MFYVQIREICIVAFMPDIIFFKLFFKIFKTAFNVRYLLFTQLYDMLCRLFYRFEHMKFFSQLFHFARIITSMVYRGQLPEYISLFIQKRHKLFKAVELIFIQSKLCSICMQIKLVCIHQLVKKSFFFSIVFSQIIFGCFPAFFELI